MFKWIKRIIKLVILIIILTPIIMLILMYKGYSAPLDDFEAHENLSFNDIASHKLDTFLADNTAESFDFIVTEAEANAALKSVYAKDNPNFGKTESTIPESERKYAIEFGNNGGFKGASIKFDDSGLSLEAGIDAGVSGIYYQTTLYLDLDIIIEQVTVNNVVENQYKLVIKDIKIGNLPILWMYDLADWVTAKFIDNGLNGLISDAVSGFGNYDLETKSIWVTSTDIINLISDIEDPNRVMLEALLGFIDEEELLASGFTEESGGISLNLGKMRSSKVAYQTQTQITSQAQLDNMFQNQLTSLLLSSIGGGTNLNYDMHEESFNQLIEYYVGTSMDVAQNFELGSSTYILKTLPLYAEFIDNKVHFTIIMHLYNDAEPTKIYQTDFTLVATPSISADKQDLIFTIEMIHIGHDTIVTNDKVTKVLELVGDVEMIQGNQIILEDFMGNFANSSVTVDSVLVNGKYLRFVITPSISQQQALTDLQNEIDDALATILSNPQYSDLQDAYSNDPSDVEGLLDALNELDPVTQNAFYNQLYLTLGTNVDIDLLLP